jgi:5-hydroxyisourate hydrolase-like protein (transthyretin family)
VEIWDKDLYEQRLMVKMQTLLIWQKMQWEINDDDNEYHNPVLLKESVMV